MTKVFLSIILFLLNIGSLLREFEMPNIRSEVVQQKKLREEYAQNVAAMVHESHSLDGEENILIVKTNKKGVDFEQVEISPLQCVKGPDDRYTLLFQSGEEARKALEVLEVQEGIVYAELDQNIFAQQLLTGNKVYKKLRSAGAKKMGFELLRQFAGVKQGHNSCTVAVIDSGTFRHPDYAERLILTGYDYVDMDNDATSDLFGHGTEVTGILADCTDSLNVSFLPIRVLNATGNGKMSNLINSIYEAVDQNADILNLSLSTPVHSEALEEAVSYAINHNCTVVFAAGNDGKDISGYCPCHLDLPGLIVVGSAEESGSGYIRASYSNYGPLVDVYTIGTKIECCSNNGGYTLVSGTSFAAPHISAACAIFRLLDGKSTPQGEEQQIKSFCNQKYEVPVFSDLVPQSLGVKLKAVELSIADTFYLKIKADPEAGKQDILWKSSDESIAEIEKGNELVCKNAGSCLITGVSADFCQETFQLNVSAEEGVIRIPKGTIEIQEESFAGLSSIRQIVIPENVKIIDDKAFDGCTSLRTILFSNRIVTPDGELLGEDGADTFDEWLTTFGTAG